VTAERRAEWCSGTGVPPVCFRAAGNSGVSGLRLFRKALCRALVVQNPYLSGRASASRISSWCRSSASGLKIHPNPTKILVNPSKSDLRKFHAMHQPSHPPPSPAHALLSRCQWSGGLFCPLLLGIAQQNKTHKNTQKHRFYGGGGGALRQHAAPTIGGLLSCARPSGWFKMTPPLRPLCLCVSPVRKCHTKPRFGKPPMNSQKSSLIAPNPPKNFNPHIRFIGTVVLF